MAGRRLAHGNPYGEGGLLNDVRRIPGLVGSGVAGRLPRAALYLSGMGPAAAMIQC